MDMKAASEASGKRTKHKETVTRQFKHIRIKQRYSDSIHVCVCGVLVCLYTESE